MKSLFYSFCFFCCLLASQSCSKEMYLYSDDTNSIASVQECESGESFAKILAKSFNNNPELSAFIEKKTKEAFDGDNNFLIIPSLDIPQTRSGKTFRTMLVESMISTKSTSDDSNLDTIIKDIEAHNPLLQVYLMNAENWNGSDKLMVAYLPSDYDEQSTQYVPAFDENGKKLLISPNSNFDEISMLVVSTNERTAAVEKERINSDGTYKNAKPVYSNEQYNYYLLEDMVFEPQIFNPSAKGPIVDGIEAYVNCIGGIIQLVQILYDELLYPVRMLGMH